MANVTATIHVQTTGPVPVPGATVRVYDAPGTTFLAEQTTDGSGNAVFILPGANPTGVTYLARVYLAGDTFSPASFVVVDTSPTLLVNITGQVGPTALLATLVVSTDDLVPVPVDGVTCRIYDSTGGTLITEGVTGAAPDPAGTLNVPLVGAPTPGTTYIVRLQKEGVTFPAGAAQSIQQIQPLTGLQTDIFDFVAHIPSLPITTNPRLCKLSGTFVDASLRPLAGLTLEFKQTPVTYPQTKNRFLGQFYGNPLSVAGQVLGRGVQVQTDKNGYVEVDLPRGGTFEVHVYGLEDPLEITSFITVPDAAGLGLLDVMWPFVVSVSVAAPPTIGIGGSADVAVSATMSNGQVIDMKDDLADILDFGVVDSAVASVLLKDGFLTVGANGVGTTTITATRKTGVVAPRVPPVPDLIYTPVTVTVV